ncbi:MAG TPA: NAD-dependent epimerase/dehydratase family protein [Acidimicrobiales bacterium]|nr:NAD-dependent epimerase/dehydratase family protein [Acidimicrobiales bacterium]
MRALVTGGAGFIGSNLVDRLLAEGHEVDVVDDLSTGSLANLADARRSPDGHLTFHQFDVRSPAVGELMQRRPPQVVFHLAAAPGAATFAGDPLADADVDVMGSLRVLDAARSCGAAKVVFASSAAVYGPVGAGDLPVRETQPQRPLTPHGVAKKMVAEYLLAYRELHSLEFTALALGHVYGPRQLPRGDDHVVAAFARRLAAGQPCTVTGAGRQTRDFVYVDDVVDAFARAAERGGGLVLNVATGVETSIGDLYRTMADRAGVDRPAVQGPARPDETARSCLDPGRAAIHLGWKPWTTVEEGTAAVLGWWAARPA